MGWGKFLGKVADWFPGKKESLRNKEERLTRALDELTKKKITPSRYDRYNKLSIKLWEVRKKLKNI